LNQLAEFERFKLLVYATIWAKGVALVALLIFSFYLVRKMNKLPNAGRILKQFPFRVRARILFLRAQSWHALVPAEHVEELQERARIGRRLVAAVVAYLAVSQGLIHARVQLFERLTAPRDEVRLECGSR
jgi:hypothetical protein